jgi:hypothetical protein
MPIGSDNGEAIVCFANAKTDIGPQSLHHISYALLQAVPPQRKGDDLKFFSPA